MTPAPPGYRYFVYGYHPRAGASCEACNWLVHGSYETREDAQAHVDRLTLAERPAKLRLERDI